MLFVTKCYDLSLFLTTVVTSIHIPSKKPPINIIISYIFTLYYINKETIILKITSKRLFHSTSIENIGNNFMIGIQ